MIKRQILIFSFICLGQNSNLTSRCIYLTGRLRTFLIFLKATSQCTVMCKMAAADADVLPGHSPKHRSISTCHCTCSTPSFVSIIHRNSLAILERADLMLDLVELPRHPAVLLVHLNTFFQRHAGGHWLQQRRAETISVTLNALLLKNKIMQLLCAAASASRFPQSAAALMHQTAQLDVGKFNVSPR